MAKADKSTVVRRTAEVLRLILAGGEFEDIRQYASAQGWKLSERQLRRYQESAHEKLAETIYRDQRQLLGRHLAQRRALYARAIKTSDVRTALNVLRDEANLEGLYPSLKNGGTLKERFGSAPPPLSREERFHRLLAAERTGDKKEKQLMEHLSPTLEYQMSDMMMPRMMLQIIALTYTSIQLDHASMFFMSLWRVASNDDPNGVWDFIGGIHAHRFKLEVDAWELFTEGIGVDGLKLVTDNHHGTMIELFTDRMYDLAPAPEQLMLCLEREGVATDHMPTAESIARQWRDLLREVM